TNFAVRFYDKLMMDVLNKLGIFLVSFIRSSAPVTRRAVLCVVPLPGFGNYNTDSPPTMWQRFFVPESPFSATVETFFNDHKVFDLSVLEAVIDFKWNRFVRRRWILCWMLPNLIHMLFFVTAATILSRYDGSPETASVITSVYPYMIITL